MPDGTVMVVEDDSVARGSLRRFFDNKGFRTIEAESGAQAIERARTARPQVAILDYRLPDTDGMALLQELRRQDPGVAIVLLTGHGSIELAVRAIKEGADQFLTKPVELPALLVMVERLIEGRRDRQIASAGRSRLLRSAVNPFVGESEAMKNLAERAARVAASSLPVLIHGETGVGKGVLAAWLHRNGPRSAEAFVDINCAGLSADLLETELFGHQKGAFTGAVASKDGLLEIADRGTAFLDEIGDIPASVQAKLLKVIEEQRFRRLGEVEDRQVDVRLIAASHRDLPERVAAGSFRSDLYYRINVVTLSVPPLRDRAVDVPILARELLARTTRELDRAGLTLAPSAEEALRRYGWPGNVRELRNVIERAALFARDSCISAADLELGDSGPGDAYDTPPLTLRDAERRHISAVLASHGGDVALTATALGISRSALYERLKKHGIHPPTTTRGASGQALPKEDS
jgi:DNA-binding NtrC family response regulator